MECLKRGKAAGPNGIMKNILMYGGRRLMEEMLLIMNVAIKN